jgi:predicted small metal-binding protein
MVVTVSFMRDWGGDAMMKILKCKDLMPGCDFVARARTDEALLEQAEAHALRAHGVRVTPELAERVRSAIRFE